MIENKPTIYNTPTIYNVPGGTVKIPEIPDYMEFYLYLENISGRFCFGCNTRTMNPRLDYSHIYKFICETPTFDGTDRSLGFFELGPDGTTNNGSINSRIRCAIPYGRWELNNSMFQIPFGLNCIANKQVNSSDATLYSKKLLEIVISPDNVNFGGEVINWNNFNNANKTIKGGNLRLGATQTWQTGFKIYGMQIFKKDKMVMNFIPAKNTQNNKFCFYELYNGVMAYPDTESQQIQAGPINPFVNP